MPNNQVQPNLPTHILVIEDDADTRCNLIDILQLDGFEVLAVPSFTAAQREANWLAYFAIVLDRKLPDGNSETFLPQLKQLAPQAAVVIVTGYEELSGAIAALRNGASDYLIKPVDADTLRARLRQLAEKRRAELELKAANARMLQAERLAAIGQMMTGLVHESRNALQRSEACLEMLSLNLQGQQDSLELVARVQKAQKKLHELFEEVRNYAAPIKLQRTEHDLREILEETWDNLVWSRQNRKISFVLPKSGASARCSVDASRLEQVFRNIFENSLAACADPVCIEVTWTRTTLNGSPAWQLNFVDNGPGLSPEQRAKIFEPFFTTKPTGTGLGMAISQRIITEHDGTITVCDSRSEGTEIIITLPAASTSPS
ncbi:MAG: hybrid sensor histidine kinase/response regulator [Planctomycetia bacterium]|nr:hybrid sensor histidine kinase/response regulator [Planctomycetia bacterium]